MEHTPRDPYFDAYGRTENALIHIEGLVHGLYELATEYSGLNNQEPMSNAIISLIVCIEEKAAEATAGHEAEHLAYHQGRTRTEAALRKPVAASAPLGHHDPSPSRVGEGTCDDMKGTTP